MAATHWMVHRAGKWNGPYTEAQLRDYAARGVIEGNVLVKNEAEQVMPLHEAFGKDGKQTEPRPQATVHAPNSNPAAPKFSAPPAPAYSALSLCGVILKVLGILSALLGGGLLIGAIGALFTQVEEARIIIPVLFIYGVSTLLVGLGYVGVGQFIDLAIDVAKNSHRQTAYLENLANRQ